MTFPGSRLDSSWAEALVTLVKEMLGTPSPASRNVLQWDTGKGLVLMQTQLAEQGGEPTLMWLSLEQARERAASVRPGNGR